MEKETKSNYCEHCGDFHDPEPMEYRSLVRIGEVVPDYGFQAFVAGKITAMKLSDFRGKWLVVMFYQADFSALCPTELADMQRAYAKFKKLGAEVLSFSTDTVFVHQAWHESSEAIRAIEFPMGADPGGKIAYAFGTLVENDDLPLTANEGLSLRGTFLVDPTGTLRTVEIHENLIARRASDTLRKLQAAQYVDAHPGETCPPSWEPEA